MTGFRAGVPEGSVRPLVSRRAALALLVAAAPAAAFGRARGGILVDVSPLRRDGDNTDANFLEATLPGYLATAFGPARSVRVRIDSVSYGVSGSNGVPGGNGAVDSIDGVGIVDGREAPLECNIQAVVLFPDIGGYGARARQNNLALSFAQNLPRQLGM